MRGKAAIPPGPRAFDAEEATRLGYSEGAFVEWGIPIQLSPRGLLLPNRANRKVDGALVTLFERVRRGRVLAL